MNKDYKNKVTNTISFI